MIENLVTHRLVRLAKDHRRLGAAMFADLGLYPGQEMVLLHLADDEGLTQSQLIARCDVEPPTISRALQRLEQAGLVWREPDMDNRRVQRVHLTERGRELVGPAREVWVELDRQALAGFSEAEQVQLAHLVDRAIANLADP